MADASHDIVRIDGARERMLADENREPVLAR
jgi:hypothetical protein